jgi:hypothetical protein
VTERPRAVRSGGSFLDDLDRSLSEERGQMGEPSRADFLAYELPEIIDAFAEHFDDLPEAVPGRPDYRLLVGAGTVVRGYAVIGQLRPDGSMDLLDLEIDR